VKNEEKKVVVAEEEKKEEKKEMVMEGEVKKEEKKEMVVEGEGLMEESERRHKALLDHYYARKANWIKEVEDLKEENERLRAKVARQEDEAKVWARKLGKAEGKAAVLQEQLDRMMVMKGKGKGNTGKGMQGRNDS